MATIGVSTGVDEASAAASDRQTGNRKRSGGNLLRAIRSNRKAMAGSIILLVITGWSYGARQLRSQALSLRNRDFLQAAKVRGERRSYIIVFELLPTMTSLIVANFLGAALYSILTAAGLEFLGLGNTS